MVTTREYRIPLPYSVEEYRIAQLYMVAKYSAEQSEGDEDAGVELLQNEPYEDEKRKGQYTHKIYHLASKLPAWIKLVIPHKALMLDEKAWNAYPYCNTVLSSPYFTKFKLQVETMHAPDRNTNNNALDLSGAILKERIIEQINIGQDPWEGGKHIDKEDPAKFKSKKTGRGPLLPGWEKVCDPNMTVYKVVTVDVPYWGFGHRLETYVSKYVQRKIFTDGNRKTFCWLDEWYGLTMDNIREMEEETYNRLNRERANKKGVTSYTGQEKPLDADGKFGAALPATA